jgi:hypothetical protein
VHICSNKLFGETQALYCGWDMGFDQITLALEGMVSERDSLFLRALNEDGIRDKN